MLDSLGIAVRAGHHCAKPVHQRFGVQASTRMSSYLYTTTDEIDALVEGLGQVRTFFGVRVMDVQQLYQQVILDHSKAPHGAGLREPFETEVHHVNPTCGDEIALRARVDDGVVPDVSYDAWAARSRSPPRR